MKTELDERYLEILATFTPKEMPGKIRKVSGIGLFLMLIGAVLFSAKGLLLGIGIAIIGLILVGIASVIQSRFNKKARQEFIDYYQNNGALPPYPGKENEKKV